MNLIREEKIIEAILFAAGEPVSLSRLAYATSLDIHTVKKIVLKLKDSYDQEERGVQLIELEGRFQMCSRDAYYNYIKLLYQAPQKYTLTETQLETLAIIAYKQPITKSQIEQIRGVRSDHAINKLIEYNLIVEEGRLQAPGKPLLFGTTEAFLKHFGLTSKDELPETKEVLLEDIKDELEIVENI